MQSSLPFEENLFDSLQLPPKIAFMHKKKEMKMRGTTTTIARNRNSLNITIVWKRSANTRPYKRIKNSRLDVRTPVIVQLRVFFGTVAFARL